MACCRSIVLDKSRLKSIVEIDPEFAKEDKATKQTNGKGIPKDLIASLYQYQLLGRG